VQYLADKKPKLTKEVLALYKDVNDFFELFYNIFYNYDQKKLAEFSKHRKELILKCNSLLADKKQNHRAVYYLKTAMEDVFDLTGPFYALKL
jgi:hypothetical protein